MKKILSLLLLFFVFLPVTNAINIEVSDETLDLTSFDINKIYNSGIELDYGDDVTLGNERTNFSFYSDSSFNNSYFITNEIHNYFLKKLGIQKNNELINKNIITQIGDVDPDLTQYNNFNITKYFELYSDKEIKNYKIRLYLKPIYNTYWNYLRYYGNKSSKLLYFNDIELPHNVTFYKWVNNNPKGTKGYLLQKAKYYDLSGNLITATQIIPYIDYYVDITEGTNSFQISYSISIFDKCYLGRVDNCKPYYIFTD